MLSKIKSVFRILMTSEDNNDNLVTLINRLIHNIGLSSYVTTHQVHWAANVSTFCFLITGFFQIIAISTVKDDPERLFECFSVLAFCGMGVFKLHSLRRYHQSWRKLLNQISLLENTQLSKDPISSAEYESDNEECDHFSESINVYTNKFRNTAAILTRVYSFTAIIFMVSPFVEHYLCKIRGMDCLGYPHILPVWALLDDLSIYGYIATVVGEFISAVYCVCVHVAFDMTAIGIMIFVCGQFSMLRDYSSRIGGKGKRCNISKRRDNRAHFRIVRCQQTNILLINSITELDKLLSNIIGVYYLLATLTLCSVAVRLQGGHLSKMQLVMLIQYMCGTLTQLFLFCRYGDAVLHESSMGMGEGPFAAAYWCLSSRIRRELILLSAGMINPRHLHAGPFNFLDLPSFIQVVQAAYSYYAVLAKTE
ncbi:hypothetical protein PYW08_002272 [Mythimna loreyi]|uniref:Uncharacterized protein n=1 Tax=Mythimna loreyi TaxID=667449 RepID=A0ACC2R1T7_9NEOP|nr:hypothetical protein PYW08_002272 [Mythimna loreyi]